jgi:hypothetical protein
MIKILLTLLILGSNCFAQKIGQFYITDFTGGYAPHYNSTVISDKHSPNLQNVIFDEDGTLMKRWGYNTVNYNQSAYTMGTSTRMAGDTEATSWIFAYPCHVFPEGWAQEVGGTVVDCETYDVDAYASRSCTGTYTFPNNLGDGIFTFSTGGSVPSGNSGQDYQFDDIGLNLTDGYVVEWKARIQNGSCSGEGLYVDVNNDVRVWLASSTYAGSYTYVYENGDCSTYYEVPKSYGVNDFVTIRIVAQGSTADIYVNGKYRFNQTGISQSANDYVKFGVGSCTAANRDVDLVYIAAYDDDVTPGEYTNKVHLVNIGLKEYRILEVRYADGTIDLIYDEGDDSFSSLKTGLNDYFPLYFTNHLNKCWMVNGDNSVMVFDGVTLKEHTFIPTAKLIETHLNMICVANTPEYPCTVFFSDILFGAEREEGWIPKNAVNVGKEDGEEITALKSFQGKLIISKESSVWGLIGSTPENMGLIQYSDEYGCLSQGSVQEFNKKLVFLDKEAVCEFNGITVQPISRQIESRIDDISFNRAQMKAWLQTTRQDFEVGTSSDVDIYNSPGQIRMFQDEYFVKEDEIEGRINYSANDADNTRLRGSIILETTSNYLIDTIAVNLGHASGPEHRFDITVEVWQDDFATLVSSQTQNLEIYSASWHTFFEDYLAFALPEKRAGLKIRLGQTGLGDISVGTKGTVEGRRTTGGHIPYFLQQNNYPADKDLSISLPPLSMQAALRVVYKTNAKTIGHFTSQQKKLDASALGQANWNKLIINQQGDQISMYYKTGTSATDLDTKGWNYIISGDTITPNDAANDNWIQWKASFTASNQVLNSVSIRWKEGDNDKDIASIVWDDKYWLSVSTNSSSVSNDMILIMDKNYSWTMFDELKAQSFYEKDGNLYFVDYSSGSINQYTTDAYLDFTSNIDAFWESKDMDFGYPSLDKELQYIIVSGHLTDKDSDSSISLSVDYATNMGTTFNTHTISATSTGYINKILCVPVNSPARYYRCRIRNNDADYFEIHKLGFIFEVYPVMP